MPIPKLVKCNTVSLLPDTLSCLEVTIAENKDLRALLELNNIMCETIALNCKMELPTFHFQDSITIY